MIHDQLKSKESLRALRRVQGGPPAKVVGPALGKQVAG